MSDDRPVILAPSGYFLPGYKAGGPIQTLAGVIEHLAREFHFRVITRDRDLGDSEPYAQIPVNTWHTLGAAEVIYLSPGQLNIWGTRRLISATAHDVLYLNSCFSVPFTIWPLLLRRCGLIQRRPVVIGPRGELAPGALDFKPIRKRLYIAAARLLGLTGDAVWQASGMHEAQDIRRHFGEQAKVVIAPDLVAVRKSARGPRVVKTAGHLRLLFLSRISRMKNLDGALMLLSDMAESIHFSIYGPLEDSVYWSRCTELIAQLPANVTVEYGGPVFPDAIGSVMSQNHLLFLPTLGEAFGHVILEALVNGCPVLISDRTRWRGLGAAGAGWDVPLDETDRFLEILRRCVAMDSAAWETLSEGARKYGAQNLNDPAAYEENRALFQAAYSGQPITADRDGTGRGSAL